MARQGHVDSPVVPATTAVSDTHIGAGALVMGAVGVGITGIGLYGAYAKRPWIRTYSLVYFGVGTGLAVASLGFGIYKATRP